MSNDRTSQVLQYLHTLQDSLCRTFGDEMGGAFRRDAWERPAGAGKLEGRGITAVQEGGRVMERAGVALSDVSGSQLPPSATARNPQLAGRGLPIARFDQSLLAKASAASCSGRSGRRSSRCNHR